MTSAVSIDPTRSARPSRPAWQTRGGGGVLLAGALLFVATLIEHAYWSGDASSGLLLALFCVAFVACLVVYPIAMVAAVRGHGIVGDSAVGRVALPAFGVLFGLNQGLYLLTEYVWQVEPSVLAAEIGLGALGLLQLGAALVGAVVVARAGVARGVARWILLPVLAVSTACIAVVEGSSSLNVVTTAHVVSTLGQMAVGLAYLTAPRD